MRNFISNVQVRIKTGSTSFALFSFKFFTGLFLGLVLALIGEEIMRYGPIAFWFVIISFVAMFLRASKHWSALNVCVFNLVIILIGLVLRMYIVIAPNM